MESSTVSSSHTPVPTPTIAAFFQEAPVPSANPNIPGIPTPIPALEMIGTITPVDNSDATTVERDVLADNIQEVPVYSSRLNPGWSTDSSWGMRREIQSARITNSDITALEAVPGEPYSGLFFTVTKNSAKTYFRDQILGVRFRVSGGPNYLSPNSIQMDVIGSSQYKYWSEDDQTITSMHGTGTKPLDAGISLGRLGLKRDVEPNTWVEMDFWLDDYDAPKYTYVTGVAFMNDSSFLKNFYIDKVSLLVRR
jgi:hypothetical protein